MCQFYLYAVAYNTKQQQQQKSSRTVNVEILENDSHIMTGDNYIPNMNVNIFESTNKRMNEHTYCI